MGDVVECVSMALEVCPLAQAFTVEFNFVHSGLAGLSLVPSCLVLDNIVNFIGTHLF